MAKSKQYETYYKDPINSVRSFLPVDKIAHSPISIPKGLKAHLITHLGRPSNFPDDITILEYYVQVMKIVNVLGYHEEINSLLTNLLTLSQEMRVIPMEDPKIQYFLRHGKYESDV